jgi:peptidoglycan/xylan/chitin deacetylase (PgdA/CDA1 family)
MPVTITFDLEDSRSSSAQEERFVAMSHRFLEFVEERGITATVFIVGEIARSHPGVVRRVAEGGHEIGLHGLRHVTLGDVGPARLPVELREGLALLQDAAQVPVPGFRAPIFSLTPGDRVGRRADSRRRLPLLLERPARRQSAVRLARGAPRAVPLGQRPDRAALPGVGSGPAVDPLPGRHLPALCARWH